MTLYLDRQARRAAYKQRRLNNTLNKMTYNPYLNKKLVIKLVLLTLAQVFVAIGNYIVINLPKSYEPQRSFLNAVFLISAMSFAAVLNLRPKLPKSY